jgi:hypothetical protein
MIISDNGRKLENFLQFHWWMKGIRSKDSNGSLAILKCVFYIYVIGFEIWIEENQRNLFMEFCERDCICVS